MPPDERSRPGEFWAAPSQFTSAEGNCSQFSGYAAAYPIYRDLGWTGVVKLRRGTKNTPPKSFTGRDGVDPSGADMAAWADEDPDGNLVLRMAADMMGIDCDHHSGKNGGDTVAEAENRWGKLPYSPRSSSRADDPVSGIRLYRIPAGVKLKGQLEFPELGLGGVEIIQRHHRYATCWPSIHDTTGQPYQWYGIDGGILDTPPAPSDIPDLPAKWLDLDALRRPEHNGADLGDGAVYDVRQALTSGEMSRRVSARLGEATVACGGTSRHDHTRDHVVALLRYGKQGDTGVAPALVALRKVFTAAVGGDRAGGTREALGEFNAFVESDRVAELLAQPGNTDWFGEIGSSAGSAVVTVTPPPEAGDSDGGRPVYAERLLTRSDLRELPDPQPLIHNTLDQSSVALLYGHRGTLKTFIALDWALSVSTGRAWQHRNTEQRRTLYVAAEGAFGFKGRVAAWETGWHTPVGDDDFSMLPRPVNLTSDAQVANLGALIEWGGYSFIVLDTLARCMVGADENSARDIGVVVDRLYWLLDKTPGRRGVVLGVHHTGKDAKTLRGSSAFEAGVDTVYSVTRDEAVTLNREKRKDGPEPDHHDLKLDLVEGTGSGVIGAVNLSTWGVEKPARAGTLLATFLQHFATTGATKTELKNVANMTDGTFYRALSDLLTFGDLINEGTDKRPHYKAAGGSNSPPPPPSLHPSGPNSPPPPHP